MVKKVVKDCALGRELDVLELCYPPLRELHTVVHKLEVNRTVVAESRDNMYMCMYAYIVTCTRSVELRYTRKSVLNIKSVIVMCIFIRVSNLLKYKLLLQ